MDNIVLLVLDDGVSRDVAAHDGHRDGHLRDLHGAPRDEFLDVHVHVHVDDEDRDRFEPF